VNKAHASTQHDVKCMNERYGTGHGIKNYVSFQRLFNYLVLYYNNIEEF